MEVVCNHKYNKAPRYWTLERCGIKTRCTEMYYICDRHEYKKIEKKIQFNCKTVPKSSGPKNRPLRVSKGVGVAREINSVEKK